MIGHAEINQIVERRDSNTGQLNILKRGFENFFTSRGYPVVPSRSILNPDRKLLNEPEFTVDHICFLKDDILQATLSEKGEATIQDCLRTQNLYMGFLDAHQEGESDLPFCLTFRMLSVTTPNADTIIKDGWDYLTKKLNLKPQDIILKVSEKDQDMIEILKANGVPEEQLYIMSETSSDSNLPTSEKEDVPSYFHWDYGEASGFENVFGRGLTYAVRNRDGEGFTDIGNLIAVKDKTKGKTIAWEYGFGLEVLAATLKGESTTIKVSEVGDLINSYIENAEDWDNQWDVVADCVTAAANIIHAGIKPEGHNRAGKVLRDILNKAIEAGVGLGVTAEDIGVIISDYSAIRFPTNSPERVERIVTDFYNHSQRVAAGDAEDIITEIVKEMGGPAGIGRIAQGVQGFNYLLNSTPIKSIEDIRQNYGYFAKEDLEKKAMITSTAGRILSIREGGKIIFLTIGLPGKDTIQIMANVSENSLTQEQLVQMKDSLGLGDWVQCTGLITKTKTGELTIHANEILRLLTPALLPSTARHKGNNQAKDEERFRTFNTTEDEKRMTKNLEARAHLLQSIRNDLNVLGFTEVETSIIESIAGGASASPFATYINTLKQPGVLRIAPELKLKPLLRLLPRVFELGKSFRNEGADPQHNPEFTSVEGYMSYGKAYEDLMPMMQKLIIQAAIMVNGDSKVELGDMVIDLKAEWRQATFRDLILENTRVDIDPFVHLPENQAKAGLKLELEQNGIVIEGYDKLTMGKILDSLYKNSVRPNIIKPTFIMNYPTSIVPLARPNDEDPAYNDMFQLVVGRTELVKAYQELNDPILQLSKFIEQARARAQGDEEAMKINWDFIYELLKGIPPCAGFGIGIDRLLGFLLNESDIRKIIAYPLGK